MASVENDQTRAIAAFRSKASFDSYSMACFLQGGHDQVQRRRDAWNRVETALGCTDTWKLPSIYGEQTRSEQYDQGLKEGKIMFEDGIKYNHKLFDNNTWKYQLGNALPFSITTVIFLPAIRYLGSEEQSSEWVSKSLRGEIVGAYVSTELGGGINSCRCPAIICENSHTVQVHLSAALRRQQLTTAKARSLYSTLQRWRRRSSGPAPSDTRPLIA
jgi:acyl-CoA oxidase